MDIIEGVHDNSHNQVAFHTRAGVFPVCLCDVTEEVLKLLSGCYLDPSLNITGSIVVRISIRLNQPGPLIQLHSNATVALTSCAMGQ